MITAALAVGVAVTGGVALLIVGITILLCVLHNKTPNRKVTSRSTNPQTPKSDRKRVVWKSASKGTEKIKKKAEQLKEKKRKGSCCVLCGYSGKTDGPLPSPPLGVETKDPGESEVTVIWHTSSTENLSTSIDGYRIYVRLKENPNAWVKVAKLKPSIFQYRLKGLMPDKRYVAGVCCKAKTGDSSITETSTIILKQDPVRPGAPTEFDVIDKTFNSITLSWKPPRKTGYSRIQNYHLMIKDFDKNAKWTHLSTLQAFDRFMDYRVTNLKSDNQYRFRVNAENVAGRGPYAESVTIETLSEEPEPPDKPRGPIKYAKISHHSITLSWRPPEQDGGRLLSGYAIEYKEKNSIRWSKAGVCEAHMNEFTVARLQDDIELQFRVIAMNDVGNSKPLIGAKVRTKLLEIPLSRRSSYRLPSRDGTSRGSESPGKQSTKQDGLVLQRMEQHPNVDSLRVLDTDLEADPHVPKSDFFTYDETETGNISSRHNENRTRHSSSSALPLPPSPIKKKSNRRKRQHHDFSPLPVHSSVRITNGYAYNSAMKGNEQHDNKHELDDDFQETPSLSPNGYNGTDNNNSAYGQNRQINTELAANSDQEERGRKHVIHNSDQLDDSRNLRHYPRYDDTLPHQTPSNVAYSYSHKY